MMGGGADATTAGPLSGRHMEPLSANQVALLVAGAGLLGGLIGWLGRGLGFLLRRWWTGSPRQERASYLNTVADLLAKLRVHGMTIKEVRELEEVIQNPSIGSSKAATQLVEQLVNDAADEPQAFQSNYAMKMRAGAAYDVAEARLQQALRDMQLLVSERGWECIKKTQEHWQAYRKTIEDFERLDFEGGTHAGLAAALAGLAETERRADEIRAQVDERARR